MDSTDHELLARIAEKDTSAFDTFYARHSAQVFGLLVRILGNRAEAEDVLQEAFWQVWQQAHRYDQTRGCPAVWIAVVARTRGLDRLRQRRRASASTASTVTTNGTDYTFTLCSSTDPTLPVERDETAQRLRRALDQVPSEQRQLIHLAFYDGLTHQQLAEHLELPLGTVKTRIRLGMQRLRILLGDSEFSSS